MILLILKFNSKLDYLQQIVGLVSLIFSISFYHLLSKLIKSISPKERFDNFFVSSKAIIVLICIGYFLYYLIKKIQNISVQTTNPIKTETKTYLFKPEKMNLVICIFAESFYTKEYNFEHGEFDPIFMNKTFSELEKATDRGFDDAINEIYLEFMNKKIQVDWHLLKSEVIFRNFRNFFARCFKTQVKPIEPKYYSLFAISKLVVKINYKHYLLYLLTENENFKGNNEMLFGNFAKRIIKRSKKKQRCIDYSKLGGLNCNSQENCLDRCFNTRFINEYKNMSIFYSTVIDKQHFTEDQWNKAFLNIKNVSNDFEVLKECRNEFEIVNCFESKFEAIKDGFRPQNNQTMDKIDLYYDVIYLIEREPSTYKILIDLLNIESILLGMNVLKLFMMFQFILKTKFKFIYLIVIYLICSTGFVYHTYFIFDEILNGELIHHVYYKLENFIKMPEIIFCFNYDDSKIDQNYLFNKYYLNEITENIRIESLFEYVTYLNKSNEWITLKSNNSNSDFKIDTFYFFGNKCFRMKQEIAYNSNQFYLLENTEVLKIKTNKEIHKTFSNILFYFFTKASNRLQFSRINELNFFTNYKISQETTELTRRDRFNYIKNPSLLFYSDNDLDDSNEYLVNLINNFEQVFKSKTCYLPSGKKNLNYEINDDLFEQYYYQNEKKHNLPVQNLNSKKLFTKIFFEDIGIDSEEIFKIPNFTFKLSTIKNVIEITNEENLIKLILSLLNALSLWFDVCLLDLHICIHYINHKIKCMLIGAYNSLVRIRCLCLHLLFFDSNIDSNDVLNNEIN